jgi:hypothetical protein
MHPEVGYVELTAVLRLLKRGGAEAYLFEVSLWSFWNDEHHSLDIF